MTVEEFSNQFDTMLSSFASSAAFGEEATRNGVVLDEYEKSVFLTKAQEELVRALYTGKNSFGDTFEGTEEMRRHLSNIVREATLSPIETTDGKPLGMESNSKFFTLPENLWFITYEAVSVSDAACDAMSKLDVFPVKQDEYHRIKRDPFRGANGRRAFRLDLADGVIEIISKKSVSSYYIRYIKKLQPIILEDLPDDITIRDVHNKSECELHDGLHEKILENAVLMALQSKGYNTKIENK